LTTTTVTVVVLVLSRKSHWGLIAVPVDERRVKSIITATARN